jgi:Domain of unknown function (DUF4394)/PEP-CTERM motif
MSTRLFLIAITAVVLASAVPAQAVPFAGLVVGIGDELVGFDSATPGTITSSLTVTGLLPGDGAVGRIATQPATGELYGITYQNNTIGNPVDLYTINTTTGVAAFVARTSVPITDSISGIAFDPVTGALRMSAIGGNFLVDPVTGATVVEGSLAYAAGDRNAGATPFVGNIAYTNQDQLYGLDLVQKVLFLVDQPSTGVISTVGPLGIQPASFAGFDIVGATDAFMSTGILPGVTGFYNVDLGTGGATLIGTNVIQMVDIAQAQIGPLQRVPEPTSVLLLGLALAAMLVLRRRNKSV